MVQLKLVLTVTIFHELTHHLSKIRFDKQATPPEVDFDFVTAEAGLALERRLFAGLVSVIWRTQDVAQPEKILYLVIGNDEVNLRSREY